MGSCGVDDVFLLAIDVREEGVTVGIRCDGRLRVEMVSKEEPKSSLLMEGGGFTSCVVLVD